MMTLREIVKQKIVLALYDISCRWDVADPLKMWERFNGVVAASALVTADIETCYNSICKRMNVSIGLQKKTATEDYLTYLDMDEAEQREAMRLMRDCSYTIVQGVKILKDRDKDNRNKKKQKMGGKK